MRWSLRTFLLAVVCMAILTVFAWDYYDAARYRERIVVLGPVTRGKIVALDSPADDVIIRALQGQLSSLGWKPLVVNSVELTPVDTVLDEPRVYPLIGPAQLQHQLYRCELSIKNPDGSVSTKRVMVDHNHFHMSNELQRIVLAQQETEF